MTRATLKHKDEHNINEWLEIARNQVGKTFELHWQTFGKDGKPGEFEILSFTPYENNEFDYGNYPPYKEAETPTTLILGVYEIKIKNTKKYNNKVFHFEVEAYFSTIGDKYSEKLYVSYKKIEDNKYLQAYRFSFLAERI